MSTLTATVDSKFAWVRLDLDVSDVAPIPTVTITRTRLDTGATATVRPYGALTSGLAVPVGGKIVMYDTEAPLDVPVLYTAAYNSGVGLVQLNLNPGAENGILTPWVVSAGGALAVSQVQAQAGYWSFRFTPDGVTANPAWSSEEVPAVPGQVMTLAGQLWTTSAFTWSVGVGWYDNTHTLISPSAFAVALSATTWTAYLNTATAPANTAFARIRVQATGTPAAANLLYGDALTISSPISVSVASTVVIVPSNGYGWLRDPARPANSVRLDPTRRQSVTILRPPSGGPAGVAYLGLGPLTGKLAAGLFVVNNARFPVPVARTRIAPAFDLSLLARGIADRDALNILLAPGAQTLLQVPAVYNEPDRYLQPSDVPYGPLGPDQRRGERAYKFNVQEVDRPSGPSAGTTGERIADLANHYSTWGALQAGTTGLYDSASRTVGAGSLGTPDVSPGGVGYTLSGTAAHFSVTGSQIAIGLSGTGTPDRALLGSLATLEAYATVVVPVVALGAPYRVAFEIRTVDASNYYTLGVAFGLAGASTVFVNKLVAAVESTVASAAGPTYAVSQTWKIHILASGTRLAVSAWNTATVEPVAYVVDTTDASFAAAGSYGLYARLDTGNTNGPPVTVLVDEVQVLAGPTWQQIMDGAVA